MWWSKPTMLKQPSEIGEALSRLHGSWGGGQVSGSKYRLDDILRLPILVYRIVGTSVSCRFIFLPTLQIDRSFGSGMATLPFFAFKA